MASMLDAQRTGNGGLAKLGSGIRANSDAQTQAGLSRGPNEGKKLNNAVWTDTFPAQGATVDIDFVNDISFVRGLGQGSSLQAVTFTRASSGTFVGSDGLLKQYSNQGALGNNLLTFPQDFDNGAWGKNSGTITQNVTLAPDNTNTADLFVSSTGTVRPYLRQLFTVTNGVPNTISAFVKKTNSPNSAIIVQLTFDNDSGGYANFNIETESLGTVVGGTATINLVDNSYYRITYTRTTSGALGYILALTDNNDSLGRLPAYSTATPSEFFAWGAQLEVGSTATEYFPTNINQPRFDWASTAVLPQRNLLRYSNDYTNSLWTKSGTISPTAISAPAGLGGTVYSLAVSTPGLNAGANRTMTQVVNLVAGTTYTYSAYLKFGAVQPLVAISTSNFNTTSISLDLSTGNIIGNLNAINPQSIPVGDGWYRVSYSFIANTTTDSNMRVFMQGNDAASNSSWFFYVYGTQLEEGGVVTEYQDRGSVVPLSNPLLANPTSNGLLIEIARTNRLLWCRDATQVGTNLVNYSEQFDNAFWVKSTGILAFGSGSVANATTAPNGTLTADLVVETGTNDFHTISSTLGFPAAAVGGVYVASIYVKRPIVDGRRYFQITFSQGAFGNTQYATFDLQDGVVSGSASTVGTPVMTDVGDGWYRCSMAATATSTASSLVFFILTNAPTGRSPSYLGDGVSGVYMWGAQVQETYLSNYVATTTAPIIGWRNTNVTVAKNQTGIDGVANACSSLTATSANGTCIQTINLVSGSRTASVYLKRITGTGNIQVTLDGVTFSTVELSTTEWRRIVLSGTVTIPTVGVRIATSGDAVAMDFAQVEDGGFATSPIMTTSTAGGVTRAIDDVPFTTSLVGGWYNQMGGTAFADVELRCFDGGGTSALPVLGFGHPINNNTFITLITASGRRLFEFPTLNEIGQTYNAKQWVASVSFDFRINRCNASQGGIVSNVNADIGNLINTTQYTLARIFGIARTAGGGTNLTGTIKRLTYTPELNTINSLVNLSS
jgi:hypothetical protein